MDVTAHLATELQTPPAAVLLSPAQLELHQLELSYQGLRSQDPQQRSRLTASLSEHGQQSPVLVVQQAEVAGRYVLIDGYQRVAALRRLGQDTVSAVVLPLDEVAALCLAHRLRETRQRSALEQGWLLHELITRHGLSQAELSVLLGHSPSWVSRRLALVRDLPEVAQELVRRGRLSPYGAMRHLVPLARAKRSACERLLAGLGDTSVSARQLGRLSLAWHSADDAERERIVQRPLLYMRIEEALASSRDAPSPMAQLRKDLDTLAAIAHRLSRLLCAEPELGTRLPLTIDRAWQQVLRAFAELRRLLEERLDAGPGHAPRDLRAQGQGPRDQGHRQGAAHLPQHGQADLG